MYVLRRLSPCIRPAIPCASARALSSSPPGKYYAASASFSHASAPAKVLGSGRSSFAAPPLHLYNRMPLAGKRKASKMVEAMINEGDFNRINEEMQAYDKQREEVIKKCRDIQKASKNAIFSLHRGDKDKAEKLLSEAIKGAHELSPLIIANPSLRPGSFTSALEEWAEAMIFKYFLEHGRLMPMSELELVNNDEYLGGVLDFTGELNRFAIAKATARDIPQVQACRDLCEGLMGMFLQFDLRNGSLRKKYDSLKYTLKKLENTLYELSLTENGLKTKPAGDDGAPGGGGEEGGE